jgi:tetratricopeptide (TPR) repeat protein
VWELFCKAWKDPVFSKVIAAGIIFLVTAVAAVTLKLLSVITLGTAILASLLVPWFLSFYVYFLKRSVGKEFGVDVVKIPVFKPKYRYTALAGILIIPILALVFVKTWIFGQQASPKEMTILVANFDGPEQAKYRVTEIIIHQLRLAVKQYEDVDVRHLPETITEQEGSKAARLKVSQGEADIVIWGWYGKTEEKVIVTIHFELFKDMPSLMRTDQQMLVSPVSALETFTIQQQLSGEMAYLTLLILGLRHFQKEKYDEAIEKLNQALNQSMAPEQMVDPALLHFLRGNSYYFKSDFDKALADFSEVVRRKPDSYIALIQRGSIYAVVKGDIAAALADFNHAISIRPNQADGYKARAGLHILTKNPASALPDLNFAMTLQPDFAEAFLVRGIAFERLQDSEKALADLTRAIQLKPTLVHAYKHRASVYAELNDPQRAIADLSEALRLQPNESDLYKRRGATYSLIDPKKALSDLNEAVRLEPSDAEAYFLRGLSYSLMGDDDQAIREFDEALSRNANDSKFYFHRGLSRRAKSEFDGAILDFTSAINLQADNAEYYKARGAAYGAKHDYTLAIRDLDRTITIDPNDYEAYLYRGKTLAGQRKIERAIVDFSQAIRLKHDYCEAYVDRGAAYLLSGRKDMGKDDLKQAVSLCKNQPLLQKAVLLLKRADAA